MTFKSIKYGFFQSMDRLYFVKRCAYFRQVSFSDTFSAYQSNFRIQCLELIVDKNYLLNHIRVYHKIWKSVLNHLLCFFKGRLLMMGIKIDPIRPFKLIVKHYFRNIFINWVQLPFESFVERFINDFLIKYALEQTREIFHWNVCVFLWHWKQLLLNWYQLRSSDVTSIQIWKVIKGY